MASTGEWKEEVSEKPHDEWKRSPTLASYVKVKDVPGSFLICYRHGDLYNQALADVQLTGARTKDGCTVCMFRGCRPHDNGGRLYP